MGTLEDITKDILDTKYLAAYVQTTEAYFTLTITFLSYDV